MDYSLRNIILWQTSLIRRNNIHRFQKYFRQMNIVVIRVCTEGQVKVIPMPVKTKPETVYCSTRCHHNCWSLHYKKGKTDGAGNCFLELQPGEQENVSGY